MFDNLNIWELIVLALLGLFIFGPERLPKLIAEAMRVLRGIRQMARNASEEISREIGTDVSLEDLHPKRFIQKHLFSEEDARAIRQPFEDAYRDVQQVARDVTEPPPPPSRPSAPRHAQGSEYPGQHRGYDDDAT